MGLLIHLYRDSSLGDCSAGGITSTAVGLCVVNVPGPFGPTAAHPAVILTTGHQAGRSGLPGVRCHVRPHGRPRARLRPL